ncbi:response regulator transcription factor [Novosphingobium sp. SL115]|uniref:response regulator transcription factor n=1 Tax=Novosphingobium sp. SL115 TaxID=2995150 RepID=UPI003FA3CA39
MLDHDLKASPAEAAARIASATQAAAGLSNRQLEILRHIREGHSNKSIARLVGLSEYTVRGHVQRILKVTGAINRTSAVFLAEQAGLL